MERTRPRELALLFLRLGVVAFGGPAVHIALMRDELVRRRGWLDDQRFLDLMAATNLVPGPNSTELAIHLGHERGGWRGFWAAGLAFILPAALLVTGLAWVYVEWGSTPVLDGVLAGVVPVVVAIVVWSAVGLGPTALHSPWLRVLAAVALVTYLLGAPELAVLLAGGVLGVLVGWGSRRRRTQRASGPQAVVAAAVLWAADRTGGAVDLERLATLGWTMLRIGAVLYGGGYVLLAFLDGEYVERLGWLTRTELLDAVAVGQMTPGPLFTSATFVGFLVAGLPGALVATVAIFAPSFLFVALLTRVTSRLRARWWTAAFLDGVNATGLALMVGVAWLLGREAFTDVVGLGLALVTLLALWRTRLNSAWLVLGGAVVGGLIHWVA
ncbi:chromate efflux transporter [Nocardioides daphniae]|uniref:Chromate transporter n=1 Tax=Nocardioides daphniae TaxID=402297 RepID=A0ABQ1Q897_9ACTN|nr:chromate efflux transporter [Nocardioides daphniae]GGD16545.1 chromate transporter [Nocardioides daphniae]